jgi:hypothetical protein
MPHFINSKTHIFGFVCLFVSHFDILDIGMHLKSMVYYNLIRRVFFFSLVAHKIID